MRIREAELREIRLSLREPFAISSGSRQERRIVLLRLEGEDGEGWGECVAGEEPNYFYETTETAWHVLVDYVLPALVGREADEPQDLLAPLSWIRGHRMALAAAEMAAWDLRAREVGRPLAKLLGADPRPVPAGVSVGLQETDDELLRKVEAYVERGYRRVKIKIKPGRDVGMMRRVRERFPEVPVMADANSAYTLADRDRLLELDELDLMMVEQPLGWEDYLDHARLQEAMRTPLCLDESIRSQADTELALELGSCRIVNIKPGRVGGHGPSRAIHDHCFSRGVPVWCGGMLESGIGRAHNVSLASLPGFVLPGDISESRRYWEEDIVEPEFQLEDGTIALPPGPGIAVEPRRERIEALTVRREVVR